MSILLDWVYKTVGAETPKSKKIWLTGFITLFLAIVGAGSYAITAYVSQQKNTGCVTNCSSGDLVEKAAESSSTPTPTPTPKLVERKLDGVLVPEGQENIHPLAVMIENHPDARPQSGLSSANVVYEAIAEGGITRFMAIFADPNQDIKVGPIRSARTYFVSFANELQAFYAHVGGNFDALNLLKEKRGALDLDQFALGAPTYWRENTRGVALEHTMYSNTSRLWQYATATKRWSTEGSFSSWIFSDPAAENLRPSTQTVTVNFSESSYRVDWKYDPTTNLYTRYLANKPHTDANNGKAITASNIILETVSKTAVTTAIGEHGWAYTLTGSGKAVLIQNGSAKTVTWKKDGENRTRYYDSDGKEITVVRGTTWVEIVHSDTTVTY